MLQAFSLNIKKKQQQKKTKQTKNKQTNKKWSWTQDVDLELKEI